MTPDKRVYCYQLGLCQLTVFADVEAEGRLQLADVVANAHVQALDSSRGEGVVELQGAVVQHGQRAALRAVRRTVCQETPAHPHWRTKARQRGKKAVILCRIPHFL